MAEHPRLTIDPPATARQARADVAELELSLLLDAVRQLTGYDFAEYSPIALRRRIAERTRAENVTTVTGLLERVLHDDEALAGLLDALSARVADPFEDVAFFRAVRGYVVRWLRTFPVVRAWVAGNAIDAFALAIAFGEEHLERALRIYATEPTQRAAERASLGMLSADATWRIERNYLESGGRHSLNDYLAADTGDAPRFADDLRRDLVFSTHHLPTDGSFNEFQFIVVPHIVDTYGAAASYRLHRTIYQSLALFGLVYFGPEAHLADSPHARAYEPQEACQGLFRRVR